MHSLEVAAGSQETVDVRVERFFQEGHGSRVGDVALRVCGSREHSHSRHLEDRCKRGHMSPGRETPTPATPGRDIKSPEASNRGFSLAILHSTSAARRVGLAGRRRRKHPASCGSVDNIVSHDNGSWEGYPIRMSLGVWRRTLLCL